MRFGWVLGNPEKGAEIFFDVFTRTQIGWYRQRWIKCLPPHEHTAVRFHSFGIGFAAVYVAIFRVREAES